MCFSVYGQIIHCLVPGLWLIYRTFADKFLGLNKPLTHVLIESAESILQFLNYFLNEDLAKKY